MTFEQFCANLDVTAAERVKLAIYLAAFRAAETIRILSVKP